jgi:hypothetical protein
VVQMQVQTSTMRLLRASSAAVKLHIPPDRVNVADPPKSQRDLARGDGRDQPGVVGRAAFEQQLGVQLKC